MRRRQLWVKVRAVERIGSRSDEETTLGEGHRRRTQDWVKVTVWLVVKLMQMSANGKI